MLPSLGIAHAYLVARESANPTRVRRVAPMARVRQLINRRSH
jgi:hypothetical protein